MDNAYRLPDHFYTMPVMARTSCTTKDLKSLMLQSTGKVFAHGKSWDIKHKKLGGGVVELYLKETFSDNESKKKVQKSNNSRRTKDALQLMVELYEKETGKSRNELPSLILESLK